MNPTAARLPSTIPGMTLGQRVCTLACSELIARQAPCCFNNAVQKNLARVGKSSKMVPNLVIPTVTGEIKTVSLLGRVIFYGEA